MINGTISEHFDRAFQEHVEQALARSRERGFVSIPLSAQEIKNALWRSEKIRDGNTFYRYVTLIGGTIVTALTRRTFDLDTETIAQGHIVTIANDVMPPAAIRLNQRVRDILTHLDNASYTLAFNNLSSTPGEVGQLSLHHQNMLERIPPCWRYVKSDEHNHYFVITLTDNAGQAPTDVTMLVDRRVTDARRYRVKRFMVTPSLRQRSRRFFAHYLW